MLELLILAVVLFCAGVAGTIIYDKVKADQAKQAEVRASRPRFPGPETTPAPRVSRKRAPAKSMQDINEEFLAKFSEHMKSKPSPLTAKDLSTQSTLTVNELIAKIEEMKKKL